MKKTMFAPIVLFVYNRPNHTLKTLLALKNNTYASSSELFIFADGPKEKASDSDLQKIHETRMICKKVDGFKKLTIFESEHNKGLSNSIISGVTKIISEYGKIIVLEDDIITDKNFLAFMNASLDKYCNNDIVYAISGWFYPLRSNDNNAFFLKNGNCWGWATWENRWLKYKKDTNFYRDIFTTQMRKEFNVNNTIDYWSQIEDNHNKIINTWFIFWYATVFINKGLFLYPAKSFVRNIGCDGSGEHCNNNYHDSLVFADLSQFILPDNVIINNEKTNEVEKYNKMINNKQIFLISVRQLLRFLHLYSFARNILKKWNKIRGT